MPLFLQLFSVSPHPILHPSIWFSQFFLEEPLTPGQLEDIRSNPSWSGGTGPGSGSNPPSWSQSYLVRIQGWTYMLDAWSLCITQRAAPTLLQCPGFSYLLDFNVGNSTTYFLGWYWQLVERTAVYGTYQKRLNDQHNVYKGQKVSGWALTRIQHSIYCYWQFFSSVNMLSFSN